jgi:predicted RNase H-like HicB family nuclease
MKVNILNAAMTHNEENGYLGNVRFEVEGHKQPYEVTLQSNRRVDEWNYALNFANEPGSEEEIEAVEKAVEEEDDLFDNLLEAAMNNQTETDAG